MTGTSGVSEEPSDSKETELVSADSLIMGDEIELGNGQVVQVREVELYPRGRSMRGRKQPKCRIRVTIRDENGSSGGLVTAARGDHFTKLVGVRLT